MECLYSSGIYNFGWMAQCIVVQSSAHEIHTKVFKENVPRNRNLDLKWINGEEWMMENKLRDPVV